MADNYLEKQHEDYLKRQARKAEQRKRRLHAALVAYRKQLAKQQKQGKE